MTNIPIKLNQRAEYINTFLRLKEFEGELDRLTKHFAENPSDLDFYGKRIKWRPRLGEDTENEN